jgi:outer membrane PBP1 activator LpoA protein
MGVATTYNPGSMSRFNALLLVVLATLASPAFSADPSAGTTLRDDDIDPATGLARSTVVRPLRDAPPPPDARPIPRPIATRPHVALILPTANAALGRLAEAVRAGFMTASEVAGKEGVPVTVTAVDNEATALVEACRRSQEAGALLVVGGFTRDGAHTLATSDCARQPVLALNELRGELPPGVFSVSLSLEQEARQAALLAVADGWHSAIVIGTNTPLSRRVQEAFEREWTRAAGEFRRAAFSGNVDDAPLVRERIAGLRGDMVFFALDQVEARAVRPYVSGMLPVYATTLSVNPRAEAIVNVDLQGVRYLEMPWFVHPDHPAVMVYPAPKGSMSVEHERLYAFGIDAFRIALLVTRGDPTKAALDGVTGRITFEEGHFVRALAPAEVDGGRVIPLRPSQ